MYRFACIHVYMCQQSHLLQYAHAWIHNCVHVDPLMCESHTHAHTCTTVTLTSLFLAGACRQSSAWVCYGAVPWWSESVRMHAVCGVSVCVKTCVRVHMCLYKPVCDCMSHICSHVLYACASPNVPLGVRMPVGCKCPCVPSMLCVCPSLPSGGCARVCPHLPVHTRVCSVPM